MAGVLTGKVAVITGAGRGIGRAVARAYAREGASLVLASDASAEITGQALDVESWKQELAPRRKGR